MRLVSVGSPSSQETLGKSVLTSGYAGGPIIFLLPRNKSRNQDFAYRGNTFCPTGRFLQLPAKSAFKRLILETPLYQHLLLTMSSTPTSELNDAECEKGHVTQRPPIPYATSKAESTMKASRETIKMKTSEGEVKVAVLGDSPGAEEYLQHLNTFT